MQVMQGENVGVLLVCKGEVGLMDLQRCKRYTGVECVDYSAGRDKGWECWDRDSNEQYDYIMLRM